MWVHEWSCTISILIWGHLLSPVTVGLFHWPGGLPWGYQCRQYHPDFDLSYLHKAVDQSFIQCFVCVLNKSCSNKITCSNFPIGQKEPKHKLYKNMPHLVLNSVLSCYTILPMIWISPRKSFTTYDIWLSMSYGFKTTWGLNHSIIFFLVNYEKLSVAVTRQRRPERGEKRGSVTKRPMRWISPLVAMETAVVDEWFSVQLGSCKE